jgi:hypothetical protein
MPEATMHKHHNPQAWKDYVGRAREIPSMQPKAKSQRVRRFPNSDFW